MPGLPRSPGAHIVGPWVIDSINLYRDLRTGTQYIGNWASRACYPMVYRMVMETFCIAFASIPCVKTLNPKREASICSDLRGVGDRFISFCPRTRGEIL